jgi:predicted SprT family Zn-dependent metalloprotease
LTAAKDLHLENFLLKFLDLIIHHEVPKLKLFLQHDLLYKTTAQQPKVQQFESTELQDPQTAAAKTSGRYYYSCDGKLDGKVRRRSHEVRRERGERVGKKIFPSGKATVVDVHCTSTFSAEV